MKLASLFKMKDSKQAVLEQSDSRWHGNNHQNDKQGMS